MHFIIEEYLGLREKFCYAFCPCLLDVLLLERIKYMIQLFMNGLNTKKFYFNIS